MEWASSRLDDDLAAALDTRRIAAVIGELGAAIAVIDPELRLLAWNRAATALFKWGPDALGQQLHYRTDDVLALRCALAGGTTHLSTIGRNRDGHELIVSSVMAPVWGADGTVIAAMTASFDRTTEVSTARRARLQQRRQAVLLRLGRLAMQDGTDADIVRAACRLAQRLLPAAALTVGVVDEAGGLRPVDDAAPIPPMAAEMVEAVARWAREGKATDHVVHAGIGDPTGRTSVFLVRADDGQSLGLVARTTAPAAWSAGDLQFLAAIASYLGTHLGRRRMAAALRSRALYDDVTGLANRSHLSEVLGTALTEADEDGPHVGLLFFDVDRFKEINDRFGHKGGDVVLLEMAARLRESAGERDLVARLGGDEFVVLARDVTSQQQLLEIAAGFMDALSSPFVVANRLLRVTASCGVALADGSLDEEEALRRADVAMYDAKRNGRAHVRLFSSELGLARTRELRIDAALRERASAGEFTVTYQPRLTLPGRDLGAIEARIHARGVPVADSGRFLQLADELGTSLAIVAEAIVHAVSAVFGALPAHSPVRAVVQLPADMLGEPVVAGAALDALASLGVAPSRLTLQASGAGVFGTDDSAIHPSLVEAGVRFAVMDLGAETTALRGFFDPWAHEVLLAEELVSRLGELEVARHLAEAAASVAINLGLAVVGDGVTDERQLELLQAAGCAAAQGPLWGERMTADELAKWLDAATQI
jgi:diguanylate cyclase (GGDEF)-like protein